ncbi:MAG TPA: PAS domain S-box protein, partial [Blastocatellia bacterium]|nr:PAS domain S-box protein [Blastocatellia bacterium]
MKRRTDMNAGKPTRAWFWLGIAAVAIITLIARWALYLEQQSFGRLQHTYELIITTDDLLSNLTDAEASALEYMSTKEPLYLDRYTTSHATLNRTVGQLSELVQNDPAQRARLEKLRPLIGANLNALSICTRVRSPANLTGAATQALADRRRSMTQVRELIDEMKHEEQNVLARYSRRRESRLRTGLAALISSALLASCCLLLGQTILNRNILRRQRAEEGLDVSEKRFEILCEQAPVGIYETDAQGMCVYTNPRWTQMSGLSSAESLGQGWAKVLHPDDRATVYEGRQTAALEGASWEYRLTPPQGGVRWIRALGGPIFSSKGTLIGYVGTLEDVTDRKLAAHVIQEREALNRAVLNSLPASIAVLNNEGVIQTANETWQHFEGAHSSPPACFVDPGVNYLDVCRKAAAEGSAVADKAVNGIQDVLSGKLRSFEMQYACDQPAGKTWFHMVVTPLSGVTSGGAAITHIDVTRRKQA